MRTAHNTAAVPLPSADPYGSVSYLDPPQRVLPHPTNRAVTDPATQKKIVQHLTSQLQTPLPPDTTGIGSTQHTSPHGGHAKHRMLLEAQSDDSLDDVYGDMPQRVTSLHPSDHTDNETTAEQKQDVITHLNQILSKPLPSPTPKPDAVPANQPQQVPPKGSPAPANQPQQVAPTDKPAPVLPMNPSEIKASPATQQQLTKDVQQQLKNNTHKASPSPDSKAAPSPAITPIQTPSPLTPEVTPTSGSPQSSPVNPPVPQRPIHIEHPADFAYADFTVVTKDNVTFDTAYDDMPVRVLPSANDSNTTQAEQTQIIVNLQQVLKTPANETLNGSAASPAPSASPTPIQAVPLPEEPPVAAVPLQVPTQPDLLKKFISGMYALWGIGTNVNTLPGLAPAPAKTPAAPPAPARYTYIQNSRFKVGVDKARGGTIMYLSTPYLMPPKWRNVNLINNYDCGRNIQPSWYGCYDGSCWMNQTWLWNPIQCGSWSNKLSQMLSFKTSGNPIDKIHATLNPRSWAGEQLVTDTTFSMDISLMHEDAVKVMYNMKYTGKAKHSIRVQEMPAVFADRRLGVLVSYFKDKIWTGDSLDFKMPDEKLIHHPITEHWAAWVDPDTGYGLGVFVPRARGLVAYRVGSDGSSQKSDCSYFAATRQMTVEPGMSWTYTVYISAGRVDKMRETFAKIAVNSGFIKGVAGPNGVINLPSGPCGKWLKGADGLWKCALQITEPAQVPKPVNISRSHG